MFWRTTVLSAMFVFVVGNCVGLRAAEPQGKPNFEPAKLSVFPQSGDKGEGSLRLVKPGHWSMAAVETKGNHFDFNGQLEATVKQGADGAVVELPGTAYRLDTACPAVLPKGEPKRLEFPVFVPNSATKAWMTTDLQGSGSAIAIGEEPLAVMKPYQYFLVVLAGEPDRYRPLETLDSIRGARGGGALNYYRVAFPRLKKPLPLAASALEWSGIAYVVWDDVDPEVLSSEQRQALVDWLYQGGQLIISGPKSLDQLAAGGFLQTELPAAAKEPMAISSDVLAAMNSSWTLSTKGAARGMLKASNPWNGVKLELQAGGEFVSGTGELVAQRRVGRGRVVVTAFRLSERELWEWPGFDGFVNGCLLLRPARKFSAAGLMGEVVVNWAESERRVDDPQWVTGVRYASRDWSGKSRFATAKDQEKKIGGERGLGDRDVASVEEEESNDAATLGRSIGSWNDDSDVSDAAREALRDAAGIVIPKSGFVLNSLAVYLIVLGPVNWLVFRTIGRVEWAWVAAPIIAVGGMVAVVRLAQLDIGFARSETEIGILEVHNAYARGLLTRFTALYTSLSTNYEVRSENADTLILPLANDSGAAHLAGQAVSTVTFRENPEVQLTGFSVASNATGMLHSEQMIADKQLISYTVSSDRGKSNEGMLEYGLPYPMVGVVAIRKTMTGDYETAWIGELGAGSRVEVKFERGDREGNEKAGWSFDMGGEGSLRGMHLSLQKLAELFYGADKLARGESRLIGVIQRPLAGLSVEPAASQSRRGGTLVVATLEESPFAEAQVDVNSRREIAENSNATGR